MGRVERFEDLVAWQRARELTRLIYSVSSSGNFAKDWGLKDQIRRASVSIMSNVAEGFDRGGRAEFHQFLVVAKGSCAEVRAQLYVALDAEYVSKEQFDKIYAVVEETGRIVNGLRIAVERQRDELRG
ncbi:MAG TPA: four helix bundle protein [Gammaproteobacteria bacterium]|nr:four helix bundle protein [Gammaproteobacteria bacterium]